MGDRRPLPQRFTSWWEQQKGRMGFGGGKSKEGQATVADAKQAIQKAQEAARNFNGTYDEGVAMLQKMIPSLVTPQVSQYFQAEGRGDPAQEIFVQAERLLPKQHAPGYTGAPQKQEYAQQTTVSDAKLKNIAATLGGYHSW